MESYSIYFIENLVNHKGYVGMTSRSVEERMSNHIRNARNGSECFIHKAIRKYEGCNFDIVTIDVADSKEEAFELESKWIRRFDTYKSGYNMNPGGGGKIGSDHYKTDLKEKDVIKIRKIYANEDKKCREIAKIFSTTEASVVQIVRGDSWSNVGGPISTGKDWGDKHGRCKLTEKEVIEIRSRYSKENISQEQLGSEYDVSQSAVYEIVNGKTWSNLETFNNTSGEFPRGRSGESSPRSKLTEDQVREIRWRYENEDTSHRKLAKEYPVGRHAIRHILNRKTWKHVG